MKDLNDLIAQEIGNVEQKFRTPAIMGEDGDEEMCPNCGEDLSLETYSAFDEGYTLAIEDVKSFLTSLALTVARATAEKLDVEDDSKKFWDNSLISPLESYRKHDQMYGWNANNAERRRRLQEWLGDNV